MRRAGRKTILVAAGVATGAAITAGGIGMCQSIAPEELPTLSAPPKQPDYLATIRAPTPPPDSGESVAERNVPVDATDLERFGLWMMANAWLPAVALATEGDDDRLWALLNARDGAKRCEAQTIAEIEAAAASGRLLTSTREMSLAAAECLEATIASQAATDRDDRAATAERLLWHQTAASNPATATAAALPSPENMAYWRTAWPHQDQCREGIRQRAERISESETASEATARLQAEFEQIADCMTDRTHQITNYEEVNP